MRLSGSSTGATVRLTLAAPRPRTQVVPVRICINEICRALELAATWRVYQLVVPPAERYDLVVSMPTFEPAAFDPQTPDKRRLGVLVDDVAVEPLGAFSAATTGVPPASGRMESLSPP